MGPDADLVFNPVMSFNVEFAARLMRRLLPYRLRWIEEPLMPHDTDGLKQLQRAVPTLPIATGEDPGMAGSNVLTQNTRFAGWFP